ncbi:unnamed protein product [Thelazia callipaeda]|uniref:Uncharacterized protein n=1 Tax=Thelazia callipaeda TaxID=103827 RepID=A0A0N5CNC7_THECL|nr:unnamed protein product [Thelazia callipaeda]
MQITPYPNKQQYVPQTNVAALTHKSTGTCSGGPDVHSQTSSNDGSSGSEKRRGRAVLPPAPIPSAAHSIAAAPHVQKGTSLSLTMGSSLRSVPSNNRLEEMPRDLRSSRQSFRIAMSQPFEFFVDNL